MTHRITILSGIQLSANPRVFKEANTLADAGYEVEVLGAIVDPSLRDRDHELSDAAEWSYVELVDAGSGKWSDRLKWFKARVRRRFWREAQDRLGIGNPQQFGYVGAEMLRYALAHPSDLSIVHNPEALWTGTELIRRGNKVAADFEDWYSEDVDPAERRSHPVDDLKGWETILLRRGAYASTTSRSLSAALSEEYDCPPPVVIYNSFPLEERESISRTDRSNRTVPSLCWFSQVAGPGRGLETLIDALPQVTHTFEIHLRGTFPPQYKLSLLARAPESWRPRIHFHRQIRHSELTPWLAEHDIGFAGELPLRRNRAHTITNKVLQYLLAGIPVLASNTPGQQEVAAMADGALFLFAAGDPVNLAAVLNDLLGNRQHLHGARECARLASERFFCWERSAPVLLQLVQHALVGPVNSSDRNPNFASI